MNPIEEWSQQSKIISSSSFKVYLKFNWIEIRLSKTHQSCSMDLKKSLVKFITNLVGFCTLTIEILKIFKSIGN